MVPPPPPPPPQPLHPPHAAMYHAQQQRNPQQQQQHSYPQGYPPQQQGAPRFGPPTHHAMQQQHPGRGPHHHHHHPGPSNYHHPAPRGRPPAGPHHYHIHPHAAVTHRGMGPTMPVPHGPQQQQLGHPPHHHHAFPPPPPRGYPMPPLPQQQHAQQAAAPKAHVAVTAPRGVVTTTASGAPPMVSSAAATVVDARNYKAAPPPANPRVCLEAAPRVMEAPINSEDPTFVDLELGSAPEEEARVVLDEHQQRHKPAATSLVLPTGKPPMQQKKPSSVPSKVVAMIKTATKKNVSMQEPPTAVMSPITMCFERMLGAAEYIKTPCSPTAAKKRGPFSKKVLPLNTASNVRTKRSSIDNSGEPSPFDELADDPDLERLVILQMAMQRNQHGNQFHPLGTAPDCKFDIVQQAQLQKRDVSRVITEGFFWREYPACEQVLYNHMHKYYEISAIQKNYKVQQYFNNVLVEEVRKAAETSGFTVDPDFCDKKLRDRIRCFYKTHLQNAKKRLATLQKHADSVENQNLVAVFIRCVRDPRLSFEESLAIAGTVQTGDEDQENTSSKKRRLDKVEKLKQLSAAAAAAANKTVVAAEGHKIMMMPYEPTSRSDGGDDIEAAAAAASQDLDDAFVAAITYSSSSNNDCC